MAHQHHSTNDYNGLYSDEGREEHGSQMLAIRSMLGNHDKDGRISRQINQQLIDCGFRLDLVTQFDDKSVQEMFDSWDINTFGAPMFVIRGLFTAGIKKYKSINKNNSNNNNNNTKNNKNNVETIKRKTNVSGPTEREKKAFEKLEDFAKAINSQLKTLENESKNNQQTKDMLFKDCEAKILDIFDNQLSEMLQKRKNVLLKKLKNAFAENGKDEEKNEYNQISNLQSIEKKIKIVKQQYYTNVNNSTNNTEIEERSEMNCLTINNFLQSMQQKKYTTAQMTRNNKKSKYDIQVKFDSDLTTSLKRMIDQFGAVFCNNNNNGNKKSNDDNNNNNKSAPSICKTVSNIKTTTISNETVTLEPNVIHKYGILKITYKGVLTVPKWNKDTNKGGLLIIHCNSLILENGGLINLNGKGYQGGQHPHVQGYSIGSNNLMLTNENASNLQKANNGGGGSATGAYYFAAGGGGGGYGTCGKSGFNNAPAKGGDGGNTYGDSKLFSIDGKNVYLGSGGGCGYGSLKYHDGRRGGGAIIINCSNMINISEGCLVSVDGESAYGTLGGGGSGGSVYLRAPTIVHQGKISAVGGIQKSLRQNGDGGMGRIRLDCNEECRIKNIKLVRSDPKYFKPHVEFVQIYSTDKSE